MVFGRSVREDSDDAATFLAASTARNSAGGQNSRLGDDEDEGQDGEDLLGILVSIGAGALVVALLEQAAKQGVKKEVSQELADALEQGLES